MERRSSKRYSVFCPIEYRTYGTRVVSPSTTLNISDGGALIPAQKSYNIGSKIMVQLFLKNKTFTFRSEVIHIQYRGKNGPCCRGKKSPYCIGIKFLERPWEFVKKFYDEIEGIASYRDILAIERPDLSLAETSMEWYAR